MPDLRGYRMQETPTVGLGIASGAPISRKFLNDLMHNDTLNKEKKLDPILRNVNPEPNEDGRNRPRKHGNKVYLERDLAIWTDIHKFTFGSSVTIGTGDSRPSWKNFIYEFPRNSGGDYFHDEFMPVVVTQMYNSPDLQSGREDLPALTLVMIRIATNFFKFDIHQLETGSFIANTDDFWVSILAIGRKGDYHPKMNMMLKAPDEYIPMKITRAGDVL